MISPPVKRAPRVSVIMSVYNAELWLADAIESVLNQSFTDFEFLIHDDGSSDGSLAILQDYVARDDRIVVTSSNNQGIAAARNLLQSKARGEFLAVMDADDICRPNRFEHQVTYLDTHPDIAVLGSFIRYIDEDGRRIRDMDFPLTHEDIDARNVVGATAIHHPTVLMRREAVLSVGGYDANLRSAVDLELWLRLAERFNLANYPAVLLDYRFYSSSISANRNAEVANNLRARQLAAQRRSLPAPALTKPWRPIQDRKSQRDAALQWAWQGWNNGYPETSRHYFLKALKLDPLSPAVWKGVIFGLLRSKKIQR